MRLTWDAYILNLPTDREPEHASLFLRRAYSLFTTNMICPSGGFYFNENCRRTNCLTDQSFASTTLLQGFLNASLRINTKIWISIIMGVMASTNIIILAEVQTSGESHAIQQ